MTKTTCTGQIEYGYQLVVTEGNHWGDSVPEATPEAAVASLKGNQEEPNTRDLRFKFGRAARITVTSELTGTTHTFQEVTLFGPTYVLATKVIPTEALKTEHPATYKHFEEYNPEYLTEKARVFFQTPSGKVRTLDAAQLATGLVLIDNATGQNLLPPKNKL